MSLTIKQENFCLAYIETGNASEAYRKAGYSKGMSDKTVNEAASRLLKDSKVIARLEELRNPVVEAAQITLESHLSDLKELRDKAAGEGKYGPAIQAEIARGKASGLHVERISTTLKCAEMTTAEIRQRIAELSSVRSIGT